jgi:hypothetical protein
MKPELGVYGPYVDEPIGMDHPLFMARTQARMWAAHAAHGGVALEDALRTIREQVRTLFGEIPQALVDASVMTAYLEASASLGGRDE